MATAIPILLAFFCWFSSTALMSIAGYIIAFVAETPEITAISLGIVGVRFFGLSRGAFRYAERLSSHSLAFSVLKKFRLKLYKTLENLVPYKLPSLSEGEMLSRIAQDAEEQKSWLPRAGVPFFAGILSVIISVSALACFNMLYAFCFFCAAATIYIIAFLAFLKMKKQAKNWGDASEKFFEFSLSVSQGMAEKKSWGIFNQLTDKWQKIGSIEDEKNKNIYKTYCIAEMFSSALPFLCIAGFFCIGANGFSFPYWIAILLGTIAAFELLQELPSIALQSAFSLTAKERLNNLKTSSDGIFINLDNPPSQSAKLELQKGDALILTAPSGTGKTLLANAIFGFLPSESVYGRNENFSANLSDGKKRSDDIIERNGNFVFLEQEPFLFTGTIADNLLFATPNANENEMKNALKKIGLPFSLDLWIGEKGYSLSGGERQKLCAARTLLYAESNNCDLIIADEPASNLPSKDEQKIFTALTEISNKPAILWLSPNYAKAGEK